MPPWHPLFTTVSEAPLAVQPERLPVSKPPLIIPPVAVMVNATVVEWVTAPSVPVTVTV